MYRLYRSLGCWPKGGRRERKKRGDGGKTRGRGTSKERKKNAREAGSKREKGKTQRAGVHLFDCESLHRNKVTEKKRGSGRNKKRRKGEGERDQKQRGEAKEGAFFHPGVTGRPWLKRGKTQKKERKERAEAEKKKSEKRKKRNGRNIEDQNRERRKEREGVFLLVTRSEKVEALPIG